MKRKPLWIGIIFGILTVALITTLVIEYRLSSLRDYLDKQLTEQKNNLVELAAVVADGRSLPEIDSLIKDCSLAENRQYEQLLGRLDQGLIRSELNQLVYLYKICGAVTAQRRATSVLLLNNRFTYYADTVKLRAQLDKIPEKTEELSLWSELLSKENERVALFETLVVAQGEIFSLLQAGAPAAQVDQAKNAAQVIKIKLYQSAEAAANIRATLTTS